MAIFAEVSENEFIEERNHAQCKRCPDV